MNDKELAEFLSLLKERSLSFSNLRKIQSEISEKISSPTGQGELNQLSTRATQLFDELAEQKKILTGFLKKWDALPPSIKTSLMGGDIGDLLNEIELNAKEINKFHNAKYEFKSKSPGDESHLGGGIADRINLSR